MIDRNQLNREVQSFLRRRHRQLQKESLEKPTRMNTFAWDYSYIAWKDWPVELRRKHVRLTSTFGRTYVYGRTRMYMDVPKCGARVMYNQNEDGCRDVWKENYRKRQRRKRAISLDRQLPSAEQIAWDREYRERRKAEGEEFNRRQQERYERWQRRFIL